MNILLISILLLAPHRVAVMDFENITGERSLDWIGTGIAQTLSTQLGRVPGFRMVERVQLDDVLKEVKLSRSKFVDPATVQRMGKLLGADTVVVGSFQKFGNDLRVTARFVDVATATVGASALIDGAYKDIFKLQFQLAKKLAGAELEAETTPTNVEAIQAFSDGVYYFRNDLIPDALALFDRALKLEPGYLDAQFYRGLALEKLERWDDAIAVFRKALPRAKSERRVKWSWDAPFTTADRSQRGILVGLDVSELSLQQELMAPDAAVRLQKRLIFGERRGKNTVLHLLDLERRRVQRLELPDDKIKFNDLVLANGRLTLIDSEERSGLRIPEKIGLYAIGAGDGRLWWHNEIKNFGAQLPIIGAASDALYVHFADPGELLVINDQQGDLRWKRQGLALDRLEALKLRQSKANGEILIGKTGNTIQAIRLEDGKDAWVFQPGSPRFSHIVTDELVIVFEWDRRVSAIEIETGKSVIDVPVAQYADTLNLGPFGPVRLVAGSVQEQILYFLSKTQELYAVALDERRVRWHVPVKRKIKTLRVYGGRVYAAAEDTGELLILDAATGAILPAVKIAPKNLVIEYAGVDAVIASGEKGLYGIDPVTGVKRWEFDAPYSKKLVTYINGVVTLKTSSTGLSALDAETGTLLWQYAGKQAAGIFVTKDSLFMVEETGVKEYALDNPLPPGEARVRARETHILTELANALIAKRALKEAAVFADKARELDPDYPPLRLTRARLFPEERSKELAAYASLVGRESQAGKRAIEELKRDHGLVWVQSFESDLIGKPELVGDKIVSVGRSVGAERQIVAMNPDDGRMIWRQTAERFVDVATEASTGRAWYVSGSAEDVKVVVLYALPVSSGERKELARWRAPSAVNLGALVHARDRLCAVTVSPDLAASSELIRIQCFTEKGEKLWERVHQFAANVLQMQAPVGTFRAEGDAVVYSIGEEQWVVNAGNGMVVRQERVPVSEEFMNGPAVAQPAWALWRGSGFQLQGDAGYVFTGDRVAYKKKVQ